MLKTTQIKNDDDVRDLSIEKRQCRFPDERWPSDASLPYSSMTCLTYKKVERDLERCNCTLPFAPIECNEISLNIDRIEIDGTSFIASFVKHFSIFYPIVSHRYCNHSQIRCISNLGIPWDIKPCFTTCTEMQINLVEYVKCILCRIDRRDWEIKDIYIFSPVWIIREWNHVLILFIWSIYRFFKTKKLTPYEPINETDATSGVTSVSIKINNQPKRLIRSVRLTNLDLVITIGSIIGLFFGATLLTFVNIIDVWILHRFWIIFSRYIS